MINDINDIAIKFELKAAVVTVVENKIIRISHHNDYEIQPEDIEELIGLFKDLRKKDLVERILMVGASHTSITPEARKIAESNVFDAKGEAIVVRTLPQRIIANFYYMVKRKSYPVKVFNAEEGAIKWLNKL